MKTHQIKIISGNLKGSNIKVIDSDGLRPTPNRVRETLFNWLMMHISGKNCLDLFAGTGVLGFEAISRGAKSVTFVEKNRNIANNINQNIIKFGLKTKTKLYNVDYNKLKSIDKNIDQNFDIIFLDPPYDLNLLAGLLEWIKPFNPNLIYIEDNKPIDELIENSGYEAIKQQRAGQVYYALIKIKT